MKFFNIKRHLKYTLPVLLILSVWTMSAFEALHRWKINERFNIKFTHIDAEGTFNKFDGLIVFDEASPEKAKFDVKIDVNSVETGNALKNESIASDNWLDAKTYPEVHFVAEGASKSETDWFTEGKLTIRGIENDLVLPFTFQNQGDSAVFVSNFTINMMDYNLSDDASEVLTIDLKIPVLK